MSKCSFNISQVTTRGGGGVKNEVVGFFDNDFKLQHSSYKDKPILMPHGTDYSVILCMEEHFDAMERQLTMLGYKGRIFKYNDLEFEYSEQDIIGEVDEAEYIKNAKNEAIFFNDVSRKNGVIKIKELKVAAKKNNAFIVDSLDIKVTDRCTMKCNYCAAGLDYMKKGQDNEINAIIEDFVCFLSKVDFIRRVFVTGGEAFLHPDIDSLLRCFIESNECKEKCGSICIITNGTVIPNSNTISLLKQANMGVLISDYKHWNPTKKYRVTELISILNKNKVPYRIDSLLSGWRDIQSIVDYGEAEFKSKNCSNLFCSPIENGRYYKCWFLLQACKLQAIPFDENDSIKIDDINSESYQRYRSSLTPGCGWCKGHTWEQRKTEKVAVAEQLREPRKYKKYFE